MQALIKETLIGDNVVLYILEGQSDVNGFGKVRSETWMGRDSEIWDWPSEGDWCQDGDEEGEWILYGAVLK